MKISCEVIQDLLPLVQDQVASEASCVLVQEHLQTCEACRNRQLQKDAAPEQQAQERMEQRMLRAMRKAIFLSGVALLAAGALLGAALTDSMGVFYNFILMPVLGILGMWLLRKKSFLVPAGVFLLSYLVQVPGLGWSAPLFYAVIYALFSGLGIGIGFLLSFAFGKERRT